MARAFQEILGLTGDPSLRRRRHQFVPSMAESTSCLEGRALLSGAGRMAHHAAANLAETAAGRRVTAMFESILHTAPTSQQLTRWVHRLHSGVSAKVLHKDLVAQVRVQQGLQASSAASASIISGQSSTSASGRSTAGSRGLPTSVRNGNNSAVGPIMMSRSAVQVPGGARLSLSGSGGAISRSFTFNQPVTTTTTTTTPATMSSTSNAATNTTGTTASTTGVSTIGMPAALTFAPLTFAPLTFIPTTTLRSTFNASVIPTNGTLPFTGTPANPSPISANGTLPFTGTPFNPSPVSTIGTMI